MTGIQHTARFNTVEASYDTTLWKRHIVIKDSEFLAQIEMKI